MTRLHAWVSGIAAVMMFAATSAVHAAPVTTTDTTSDYVIESKLRWGRNGFEGVLFTPGDPTPGTAATQLDATGAPAWSVGNFHDFFVDYSSTTGVTNLKIDFNRDSDFGDAEEAATSTSPTLIGKGFKYVIFFGDANANHSVSIKDLMINGVNFGNFGTSTSDNNNSFTQAFKESNGLFTDIAISGKIAFSGGTSQEIPRLKIKFANSQDVKPPAAVPLPASAWMGLTLLAGLAGKSLLTKRRQRKNVA